MPDKIIDLHKARQATVTHEVPSENPDRNLRDLAPEDETMARLGLDSVNWPGMAVRPGPTVSELKEIRRRLDSLEEAAGQMEIAGRLIKVEARTLARRITQIIGDGDGGPDFDPRGAA